MRRPGWLLLHPVHLVALVVLAVNDHWLKGAWPGTVSGKLSDVAGLIVLPVVIIGAVELLLRRIVGRGVIASVAGGCAAGFAAVQLWPAATHAFAAGLGALQWLASGTVDPRLPVAVTPDAGDLLTMPAAVVVVLVARRPSRRCRRPRA